MSTFADMVTERATKIEARDKLNAEIAEIDEKLKNDEALQGLISSLGVGSLPVPTRKKTNTTGSSGVAVSADTVNLVFKNVGKKGLTVNEIAEKCGKNTASVRAALKQLANESKVATATRESTQGKPPTIYSLV